MRNTDKIKRLRMHASESLKAQGKDKEKIMKKLEKKISQAMFTVDYSQSGSFAAEKSFTTLDLKIMERIIADKTYDFRNVPKQQRLQMCFNIFPRIKSVFHYLSKNPNVCDINLISDIFDSAIQGQVPGLDGQKVTIPIFQDAKGYTPMDACLNREKNIFNLKLVSVLFKKTMDYPLLHSSYLMQSAICKGIAESVPEVKEYLSHRWIDSP